MLPLLYSFFQKNGSRRQPEARSAQRKNYLKGYQYDAQPYFDHRRSRFHWLAFD